MNPADLPENRASLSHLTFWCSTLSFYLGRRGHVGRDGITTIDFVKNLHIDLSNARAAMVLNALGISGDDELIGHMDRVQFANLCASWLQQHIAKRSPKIEQSVSFGALGATFMDCGVREGYINEQIRRLSEAARSTTTGDVVYWA